MKREEQAAQLQHLKAQANLDPSNPKEKLLMELTDTVSLLCHQIYRMDSLMDGFGESLEVIQEQLEDFGFEDEEMGVEEYFDGTERPLYEVKCPQCGDRFAVDEASLVKGFSCPTCGEHLMQAE
jgi:ribosomal protein S27E